ncbi:MAG: ribose-phosphate pyrophosphokinase [Candidatus Bathyarchaeota archaeon]|nr:ribose-phosphate pyrophosphokinase [Candidatus Bathyarchaeota archaeon]MDH5787370.1 ribose-phosphate pyrophosphokinase [Candidatus Bathyarchaeota archaeon]
MKIIPGPASKELGEKIAELLNVQTVPVFSKAFPDGESYIRFNAESLQNEDVVIVQTTSPPQDQRLIQLMLMADNALDMKANDITAVVPYFAYSRQDKRFLTGEAFSIKTILKLLEHCGVNRIITVNTHNPAVIKNFNIPVEDLSAVPLLAEYFKTKVLAKNPVSVSMGKKALSLVVEADRILRGGYDYISTKRDVTTGNVTLEEKKLPVKNRNVVIFDDIISSGGTMAKAVELVKKQGAEKVYAACVHPLLMGDSKKRILENGAEEIIGTDSVPNPIGKVSIAALISKALATKGA